MENKKIDRLKSSIERADANIKKLEERLAAWKEKRDEQGKALEAAQAAEIMKVLRLKAEAQGVDVMDIIKNLDATLGGAVTGSENVPESEETIYSNDDEEEHENHEENE